MTNFEWGMLVGIAVTEGFRFLYRRLRSNKRTRDLDKRLSPYENGRKHSWTDENKQSRAIL